MLNIHGSGMPVSNPNLLINPWFTVWQRGESFNVSANAYKIFTADRWSVWSYPGATINKTEDGLRIQVGGTTGGDGNSNLSEWIDPVLNKSLSGKQFTISSIAKGVVQVCLEVWRDGACVYQVASDFAKSANTLIYYTGTLPELQTTDSIIVKMQIWTANITVDVRCVKLELGPVSTLAYDSPPDLATEKVKCQRYFERIGDAASAKLTNWTYIPQGSTQAILSVEHSEKRITPTVSFSAPGQYRILFRDPLTGNIVGATKTSAISVSENSKTTATITVKIGQTDRPLYGMLQREDNATSAWANVDAEIY